MRDLASHVRTVFTRIKLVAARVSEPPFVGIGRERRVDLPAQTHCLTLRITAESDGPPQRPDLRIERN